MHCGCGLIHLIVAAAVVCFSSIAMIMINTIFHTWTSPVPVCWLLDSFHSEQKASESYCSHFFLLQSPTWDMNKSYNAWSSISFSRSSFSMFSALFYEWMWSVQSVKYATYSRHVYTTWHRQSYCNHINHPQVQEYPVHGSWFHLLLNIIIYFCDSWKSHTLFAFMWMCRRDGIVYFFFPDFIPATHTCHV